MKFILIERYLVYLILEKIKSCSFRHKFEDNISHFDSLICVLGYLLVFFIFFS